MSTHHVLVIGGHGKIALKLTPLLLRRSWTVTSLVRNPDHCSEIEALAKDTSGKLNVLVRSIDEVKSEADARGILEEVKPDYVAFSAGAGGKGGADKTYAVDRDAAINFLRASASSSFVSRFLLISYNGCRRGSAPWWGSVSDWEKYNKEVNFGALATYYQAKIAADEELWRVVKESKRKDFVAVSLRPGTLADEDEGGVTLGKTRSVKGSVGRGKVAKVMDGLLGEEGLGSGWVDLLDGEEEIGEAVKRVVKEGVNTVEGEEVAK